MPFLLALAYLYLLPLKVSGLPPNQPQDTVPIHIDPYEGKTIPELIHLFAVKYNVSEEQIYGTIKCETNFQNIQSQIIKNGVREESYGLSQIHLPSHPHITKEQALDPVFSIEFIAKEFSLGHQRKWTCWRKMYSK